MGNLKLLLAEPWDAAEILALQFAAFTDQEPFWELLFPLNEDRDHAIQRFLRGWLGDQSVRYVKVVDEESGMFFFLFSCPWFLGVWQIRKCDSCLFQPFSDTIFHYSIVYKL